MRYLFETTLRLLVTTIFLSGLLARADFPQTRVWVGANDNLGNSTRHGSPRAAGESLCGYYAGIPGSGVIDYDSIDNPNTQDPPDYELYCLFTGDEGDFKGRVGSVGGTKICPDGAIYYNGTGNCSYPPTRNNPNKNAGCPQATTGNPISLLSGEKIQIEVDYSGTSAGTLALNRWYVSGAQHFPGALGSSVWRLEPYGIWLSTNYDPETGIVTTPNICSDALWVSVGETWRSSRSCPDIANAHLDARVEINLWNGKHVAFTQISEGWASTSDSPAVLREIWDSSVFDGWLYTDAADTSYKFDINGVLQEIRSRSGAIETLTYDLSSAQGGDDDLQTLDRIDDHLGNSINFSYDGNNITSATDAEGNIYSYSYTADNLLDAVVYPDGDTDLTNNPIRQYHYNDDVSHPTFAWMLTGISDERGVRFANWSYDEFQAISSSHGPQNSSVDGVTVDYSNMSEIQTNGSIKITNALGKETTYHYTTLHNSRRLTQVEGAQHTHPEDDTIECAGSNRYYDYDDNGYLDIVVDWENKAIDYHHDDFGREIQRVEGLTAILSYSTVPPTITTAPTTETRTITTKWHTKFRLPTRISEPTRIIDMKYNCDNGRLENTQVYEVGSEPDYAPPSCP